MVFYRALASPFSPTVRATPVVELQREYGFERISISFAWQILA